MGCLSSKMSYKLKIVNWLVMNTDCPNINIRQPLNDFLLELKDLINYRICDGDILIDDYVLNKEELLEGYRLFIADYLIETGNPAYNMRLLKWQNYY